MATPSGTVIKRRPHTYSAPELAAISDGISNTLDEQDALGREKSVAAQGFKTREKELDERLQQLRSNKKQGYEIREYQCSVIRNRETKLVEYVNVDSGEVIATEPFTTDDWDAVFGQSQLGLFPDGAPDENVIRAEAGPAIYPTYDPVTGDVIAGPETDLFNQTYPGSPYKHLSDVAEFAPALPSTSHPELDAEAQVYFNQVVAELATYDGVMLTEARASFASDTIDGQPVDEAHKLVRTLLVAYIDALLNPAPVASAEPAEPIAEALPADFVAPEGVADAPEGESPEDGQNDEDAEGDEPEKPKAPRVPKRPAKRK